MTTVMEKDIGLQKNFSFNKTLKVYFLFGNIWFSC
jgi:hypothetical protein